MTNTAKFLGAALLLCGCCAGAALAQNAPAAGQEPPPKADEGTTAQLNCLADSGGFKRDRKQAVYTVELANKCEQRLKCRVDVFVISAKGTAQGHAVRCFAELAHLHRFPGRVADFKSPKSDEADPAGGACSNAVRGSRISLPLGASDASPYHQHDE